MNRRAARTTKNSATASPATVAPSAIRLARGDIDNYLKQFADLGDPGLAGAYLMTGEALRTTRRPSTHAPATYPMP